MKLTNNSMADGRNPGLDVLRKSGAVGRRLAALALTAALTQSLSAGTYEVEHNFRLKPGGNVVPRVTAEYYAHSYIVEKRGDCEDFAVEPAQGASFNPYGWDNLRGRKGLVRNRGVDGRFNDVTNDSTAVPAGGISATARAFTAGCLSWADAHCSIDVNPFGAGGEVTGTIRAWGEAAAALRPPRRSRAYAFSMTLVEAQGGRMMRNGTIRWGRVVRDAVSGRASRRRQVDPVDYTVTDLVTGEVHVGTLYSVVVDILKAGGGGFVWANDAVEVTAREVDFHIEFPSALTSLQGELDLQVRDGEVRVAHATGHYAGVLPPVGTKVPLKFGLKGVEEFDYDLGDFDGHELDVNIDFSGAGETVDEKAADPELTVVPTTVLTAAPLVTLAWPLQNCPVVVQQCTNLAKWEDLPLMAPVTENGMSVLTLPMREDGSEFFRIRTLEGEVTDLDPPKFRAEGVCGQAMVLISYTEPVDPVPAQDPSLYLVLAGPGEPIPVFDVQMLAPDAVMLFLPVPLQPDLQFQAVVLGGVTDLAGNEIRPNHAVRIDCRDGEPVPPGDGEVPGTR